MPQYPKNELAQMILQYCVAHKIEHVIISPGSRNAPLIIGFSNHPKIIDLQVVDERCAGFFALGIAQQTKKPVALVCTSGSALLNYYPAVAEAFYSKIPLIVISADRPDYMIDIGDGQTIRQKNVFENHSLFNANLVDVEVKNPFESRVENIDLSKEKNSNITNENLLKIAFEVAISKKGPVHINVPFEEPLYEVVKDLSVKINLDSISFKPENLWNEIALDVDELEKFANIWNASSKKLVLLGSHDPDTLIQTQLSHISKDPSVLVMTETTSNVYDDKFVNSIDKLIIPFQEKEFKALQPEILITFGGMVISKKIKQFLRTYPPKHHWHIEKENAPNTYYCLTHHFKISPQLFFSQFFFLTKNYASRYQQEFLAIKKVRQENHKKQIDSLDYSDFIVFDRILKSLPKNIQLQLSNSSVIRYTQLFDFDASLEVFCNRGTSGIDGSTSTAIGAAFATKKQTVFITGDISFFYDSNGLWNNYIPKDFRIILINNSGGGIFRLIPGPKLTNSFHYFESPHHLTAEHLCKMFSFDYQSVKNQVELEDCFENFYTAGEFPKVLEIFTPPSENEIILKKYFKSLG
jgi:2-succinyl-5-enolpyruvyl-6-hydroxy-3-cyclohexene-1-carboxylate synthase